MAQLSVNINKIATLRNSRGANNPNLLKVAIDCEKYGANGITVHPRPDERHIKYKYVIDLKANITTELNVEGNPSLEFLDLVLKVRPAQCTLVPDKANAITSSYGWNTKKHFFLLEPIIKKLQDNKIRVSLFINTYPNNIEYAAKLKVNRVEFYNGPYAANFHINKQDAIKPYINAAKIAINNNIEINAGHDLDLDNLNFFIKNIPQTKEVSIGHALVCDSIYYGLEMTIKEYLKQVQ
ncbi:MAG: pyridoxine 5'-phosphate synthase [Solitalea-like symbiont of Acarus siro]